MKIDEALELLDEVVDDKEIASSITELLGLFEIRFKKELRDAAGIEAMGWKRARDALNDIAAKRFKGVKKFK